MTYPLENEQEIERLEKQSLQPGYSLADELDGLDFQKKDSILDAGCGSGLLSRYLLKNYKVKKIHACDFSELRLAQAKKLSREFPEIEYSLSSLTELNVYENNSFDYIICRYVLEHTKEHDAILQQFKRVLKPGGQLVIINFDGAFVNIYTKHGKFQHLMNKLIEYPELDLFVGRKVPTLCHNNHFHGISWDVKLVKFRTDSEMRDEKDNIIQRCKFATPLFEELFGKEDAAYFVRTYIESLDSPETVLFYNKLIVHAFA